MWVNFNKKNFPKKEINDLNLWLPNLFAALLPWPTGLRLRLPVMVHLRDKHFDMPTFLWVCVYSQNEP